MFDSVEDCLEALKRGEIVLVTDDADRENEGDCICAAEFATCENVNFMATYARGLICMPMSRAWCRKLDLPQMVVQNTDNHQTAFTVSIDAASTTTGISAAERSMTALACVGDGVISPAVGGILVGHEVARELNVKCIFAEKVQGKGVDATGKPNTVLALRRFSIRKGERYVVAEDVVTKGPLNLAGRSTDSRRLL